jgi:hypothetical protein
VVRSITCRDAPATFGRDTDVPQPSQIGFWAIATGRATVRGAAASEAVSLLTPHVAVHEFFLVRRDMRPRASKSNPELLRSNGPGKLRAAFFIISHDIRVRPPRDNI